MEGPAGALIGVSALGMGALIGYAAYKNVPVFGPNGLLTGTLKTGKLQPVHPGSAGSGGTGNTFSVNPLLPEQALSGTGSYAAAVAGGPTGILEWLAQQIANKIVPKKK
jgi:hypothetical protein